MAVAERHWSLNTTLDFLERWFRERFPSGGFGQESVPPILATQARVLAYNDGDDFLPIPREATPSYWDFGGVVIERYAPLERPGVAEAMFYLPSVEHIDTHRRLLKIDAHLIVQDPVLANRRSTTDVGDAIELDCRAYPHPGSLTVNASCLVDWAMPRFEWLISEVNREWPETIAAEELSTTGDDGPPESSPEPSQASLALALPTAAIADAGFGAEAVVARVRVPRRAKEYRNWYETWQKLRGQPLNQPYAKLAEWLEKTHPQFKCSPDLVADIIRAGQAHSLDHELSYSEQ